MRYVRIKPYILTIPDNRNRKTNTIKSLSPNPIIAFYVVPLSSIFNKHKFMGGESNFKRSLLLSLIKRDNID